MTENIRNPKKLAAILLIALISVTLLSLVPIVQAYGPSNWQMTASGNCNNKTLCLAIDPITGAVVPSVGGFWGWCAFTGVNSGTEADCQFSNYNRSPDPLFQFATVHTATHATTWDVEPSAFSPTGFDFFITSGTVSFSGPTVVGDLKANGPIPISAILAAGCTIPGDTVSCPISGAEGLGIYSPDTGFPNLPGHFQFNPAPGIHFVTNVIELP